MVSLVLDGLYLVCPWDIQGDSAGWAIGDTDLELRLLSGLKKEVSTET